MNEFARCLDELDVRTARLIWAQVGPGAHQPANDDQMMIMLHRARTESPAVSDDKRRYSHAWLLERGLPSGLPGDLVPVVTDAVGISVRLSSSALAPAAAIIQGAMSDAVSDAYADGRKDPAFVKARMAEARQKAKTQLFGRWNAHG